MSIHLRFACVRLLVRLFRAVFIRLGVGAALAVILLTPTASMASSLHGDLIRVVLTPEARRVMAHQEVDVVRRLGDQEVLITADEGTLAALTALGLQWHRFSARDQRELHEKAVKRVKDNGFSSWPQIHEEIHRLAQERPDLFLLEVLGVSREGRDILALRVATGSLDPRPAVQLVGSIHGDEQMSTEICMRALRLFAEASGSDSPLGALLEDLAIWVVPVMNPDGYHAIQRNNRRNVDLNRNYGFMWRRTSRSGSGPYSEPETLAMDALARREGMVLSLTYHTEEALVNYPWNHTRRRAPDTPLILMLSEEYGLLSGYEPINGWDWYTITGDADDYLYGTRGGINLTIETASRNPDQVWEKNKDALVAFLDNARRGLHGRVVDGDGRPVAASIWVEEGGWPVQTSPHGGDFYRILAPGSYTIRVEANGYQSVSLPVEVVSGSPTYLEVVLDCDDGVYAQSVAAIQFRSCHDTAVPLQTEPIQMLGIPDGVGFPLCGGGEVVLDLGMRVDLIGVDEEEGDGPYLVVHGTAEEGSPYEVLVGESHHGPWASLGESFAEGEAWMDLGAARVDAVQFIRIKDLTGGSLAGSSQGLVLDGVEILNASFPCFTSGYGGSGASRKSAGCQAVAGAAPGRPQPGSGWTLLALALTLGLGLWLLAHRTPRGDRRRCRARGQ